jgi:hypothetical protein
VIESLFTLTLCLQQIVPTNSPAVVVHGVDKAGRLSLQSMALGDGGVAKERSKLVSLARGRVRTPGGVLVQAQTEGVKLTFPNRNALLITPGGRMHLRTGEMTLAHLKGVRLLLADGSVVTARRAPGGRQPLSSVEVEVDGRSHRIWNTRARAWNASHVGAFPGPALLALGDGRVLYRAIPVGPMVVLERILCPRPQRSCYAKVRLAIVGDVLAASLRRLPQHAPRRSVQFPQARTAADKLAALSNKIFPARMVPRPAGAVGELWFELPADFRLKVAAEDHRVVLGLYRGSTATPAVEWLVRGRTELCFVRPFASAPGYRGPRYFMKGLDLRDLVQPLLPIQVGPRDVAHARKLIQGIGGKQPKLLRVRRR